MLGQAAQIQAGKQRGRRAPLLEEEVMVEVLEQGRGDTPPARGHPHRLRQVYSAIRWLGHRRVPSLALFIEQVMPELAG